MGHKESKETWRSIKDYEGLYEASNHGRIRSISRVIERKSGKKGGEMIKTPYRERILKPNKSGFGYSVALSKNGKPHTIRIHTLIANAFDLPRKETDECIVHIDGNSFNNKLSNLRWGTVKEAHNISWAANNTLCLMGGAKKEVLLLNKNLEIEKEFVSLVAASDATGYSCEHIGMVCNHNARTAGGDIFAFKSSFLKIPKDIDYYYPLKLIYIYFIQDNYGRVKIGMSNNADERLKTIQGAGGLPEAKVVEIIKAPQLHSVRYSGRWLEKYFHSLFEEHHKYYEWFDFSQEIKDWIKNNVKNNEIKKTILKKMIYLCSDYDKRDELKEKHS